MATPDEQAMEASQTGGVLGPADTSQEPGVQVAGNFKAILPAILEMIGKNKVDVPITEGATQARGAEMDAYAQQQQQAAPQMLSPEGQQQFEEAGGRVDELINPTPPDPVVEGAREALDAAQPGDATVKLDAKRQLNYAEPDMSLRAGSTEPGATGAATEIDGGDFIRMTDDVTDAGQGIDFNFDRMNSSEDVKATINFFSERFVGETDQAKRGVVTQKETEAEAAKLLQDELSLTRDLLAGGPGRVLNAAQMTAARILLQKSGDRLVSMATEIRRGNRDPEFLVSFRRQMSLHAGIQQQAAAAQTEIARAFNAFNIPVSARTPELRAEFADTLLGESGSAQGAVNLAESLLNSRAVAAAAGKNPNAAMNRFVQKGAGALTMDVINEVYVNGLLSWFPTHIKNFFATPMFMVLRNVEELFAGLTGTVDRGVRRAFGGEVADQEVYIGQSLARMFGQVHSLKEALIVAGEAMKRGESPDLMNKVELAQHNAISSEAFANSRVQILQRGMNNHHLAASTDVLGKVITAPGRALMGADSFWKVMSQRGELASQAYHNAARARERGESYEAALDQAGLTFLDPRASQEAIIGSGQIDTMTSDLSKAALPGAEVDIRKVTRFLQQSIPIIGRMLTPFTTAPTNTILRYLERTPIGLANLFRRDDGEIAFKNPAARNRIMARVSLSTGVMYTMHNLAMEGHFTGAMPQDANQRRKLPPKWQPYSFVMKGNGWPNDANGDALPLYNPMTGAYNGPVTYVSYAGLEPVSMILGTAANTAEMMRRTNDQEAATNYASAAIGSVAQYIGDMPMLQTIASIVKSTMYDDYSFLFNSPLGNLLPYSSAVRNIERFADPTKRRPSADYQYYTAEDVAQMELHPDGTQRTEMIGTLKGPIGFDEPSDFGKYLQEYRQQLRPYSVFGDQDAMAKYFDVMGREQDYNARFDVNPVLATYNLISPFRIKQGEQLTLAMSEHIRLGAPLRDRVTGKNGMQFDQAFQSDWMDASKNEVLVVKGGEARKFRDALDWLVRSPRYNALANDPEKQRNEIIKLEKEFFNEGFNVVIGMEKYDDVRMAYEDLLATPNSSQVIR